MLRRGLVLVQRFTPAPVLFAAKVLMPVAVVALTTNGWSLVERHFWDARSANGESQSRTHGPDQASELPTLRPVRTLLSSSALKDAVDMTVSGSWLLVLGGANQILAVDLNSPSLTKSHNLRFSETNEAVGRPLYTTIWNGPVEGEFYLGSPRSSQFSRLALGTSNGEVVAESHALYRSLNFKHSVHLQRGLWLSNGYFDDGSFVALGKMDHGTLELLEWSGQSLFSEVSSPFVSLIVHRNVITADAKSSRIAQAFLYVPQINVYSRSGALDRVIPALHKVDVMYDTYVHPIDGQVRFKHLPATTFCYVDLASTSDAFVALFSGKTVQESPRIQGDELHMYSWDGMLLGVWRLEHAVRMIAANGNDSSIWALRSGPQPALEEYVLSTAWHENRTRSQELH